MLRKTLNLNSLFWKIQNKLFLFCLLLAVGSAKIIQKAKMYTIEIDTGSRLDQSGDTVFGLSDDIQKTILLKQTVRDECLERLAGKKLKRELRLFAACCYLLIKEGIENFEEIKIDREYPGHEEQIKWILLNMIKKDYPRVKEGIKIGFGKVGKKSAAHEIAWRTLRKESNPDKVITSRELLATLLK